MTRQVRFGGFWTEQKLQVLSDYLREYRRIFHKNPRAQFFDVTYLDGFAGTGKIPRAEQSGTISLLPELIVSEQEFRKGSVRRALEVEPPFHHYVFIEKDAAKFEELSKVAEEFPSRDVQVIKSDANTALIKWCRELNCNRERAVVFLDPFGASVEWEVLERIASTKAVDLWILFPCAAVNRMLPSNRKPRPSWCDRLTRVFGTAEWEASFYSTEQIHSLLHLDHPIAQTTKVTDQKRITEFFSDRMRTIFTAVSELGYLYNSRGPLFALVFAAGNQKGAGPGLKIADHLLKRLSRT